MDIASQRLTDAVNATRTLWHHVSKFPDHPNHAPRKVAYVDATVALRDHQTKADALSRAYGEACIAVECALADVDLQSTLPDLRRRRIETLRALRACLRG